jgi:hypothetical protein
MAGCLAMQADIVTYLRDVRPSTADIHQCSCMSVRVRLAGRLPLSG